jgi:hypothetical protein
MYNFNTDGVFTIQNDHSIIFIGTREDFANEYFYGDDNEIIDWCEEQGYTVIFD